MALRPDAGHGLLILEVSGSHATTHHSRQDFSGRVISSSQRPLPDNTRHSQQTNIHARGGIRTQVLSRRAAAGCSPAEINKSTNIIILLPKSKFQKHCVRIKCNTRDLGLFHLDLFPLLVVVFCAYSDVTTKACCINK